MDTLDFLLGITYQEKVTSDTFTFGWSVARHAQLSSNLPRLARGPFGLFGLRGIAGLNVVQSERLINI